MNQNASYSNLSFEPTISQTNITQEIVKLNTNYKALNITTSSQSTPNTPSTDSTRIFIPTNSDDENTNVMDTSLPPTTQHNSNDKQKYLRNRSESNLLIRDKYSSRRWIFDQYTDYSQPRSLRVNGNNLFIYYKYKY